MATSKKLQQIIEGLVAGDRAALARAITAVENSTPESHTILKAIQPQLGRALVVGFTGPPGAGKSTLINAYLSELRKRGKSVAVLAVDPSSPVSGGAILGDRIRMSEHTNDPLVFVRSLASRGHLGGLSRMTARVVDVMDAAGRDVVVIETVGTGQSEVEVAEVAGTKVVIAAPSLGDGIQAIKAGILEIADILVVNKFDLPHAAETKAQLKSMLHLREKSDWTVPVIGTSATTFKGLEELADAIAQHDGTLRRGENRLDRRVRTRKVLAETLSHFIEDQLMQSNAPEFLKILDALQSGEMDFQEAGREVLENPFAVFEEWDDEVDKDTLNGL